jgi:hypothetical protein
MKYPILGMTIQVWRWDLCFQPFKWCLGIEREFGLWIEYRLGPLVLTKWIDGKETKCEGE